MNIEDFRRDMLMYRSEADQRASSLKDSYLALEMLGKLYVKFDSNERTMAHAVLQEWVLSEDENLRFDAIALISEFCIREAVESLTILANRLSKCKTPGAPYEREKVERVIHELKN